MSFNTFERCSIERIVLAMGNIVDTVENRTRNAILTGTDTITTLRIELPVKPMNGS